MEHTACTVVEKLFSGDVALYEGDRSNQGGEGASP